MRGIVKELLIERNKPRHNTGFNELPEEMIMEILSFIVANTDGVYTKLRKAGAILYLNRYFFDMRWGSYVGSVLETPYVTCDKYPPIPLPFVTHYCNLNIKDDEVFNNSSLDKVMPRITKLNVCGGNMYKEWYSPIMAALSSDGCKIRKIKFEQFETTFAFLDAFTLAVKSNNILTSLKFEACNLGSFGIRAVGKLLKHLTKLKKTLDHDGVRQSV